MNYDKRLADGSLVKAPQFRYGVLESVPVVFQIAQWLLVIVAFQFADVRLGYFAAKVVWLLLAAALGLYVGVLTSNFAWRIVEDPYRTRTSRMVMSGLPPIISGALIFILLKFVVEQMVAAQGGAA